MGKLTLKNPDIRAELNRQLTNAIQLSDIASGMRLVEKTGSMMTEYGDTLAGEYRCLEAKLFFLSNDYRLALTSARLATAILAQFGETEQLAEAFLLTGKSLSALGNYKEAETAYLDAESLYRRNDNIGGRIDTVNQLARIFFIRAEYKSALKYLLEAANLAEQIDDRKTLAFLWGNLGRVYTFMGNFDKAIKTLKLNISVSDELGDKQEKARALLSLGYIEMQSEYYEKAQKHFDEAYIDLVREKMNRSIIICQTYLGELKLKSGELSAARRYLDEAIDGARRLAPKSSLMVAPLRLLAELELADKQYNSASRLANKALALAEEINEPVEKGAILRLQAKLAIAVFADDTKPKQARKLFGLAMELFYEVDARYEQAETLIAMADCGLGSARRQMANLFRAADQYKRLGISSKYEKTQELINRTDIKIAGKNPHPIRQSSQGPTIITNNPRMTTILDQLSHASQSDLPVLLMGETGTGKDLLALYYHNKSGRKGDFVAVNCAAFPDTLLESELFGYRKGAFTGAETDKDGLLHRANGGTFFLDEIGEMSLISQAKLLTVIETCRTRRLGDTSDEALNIRFIAATNGELSKMVEAGTFRRDLYYRLSGITFTIPPLSQRPEDIPLLLQHFLIKEGVEVVDKSLDPELVSEFTSRSWPGNVRQLESEVKKLVLFSTIAKEDSLSDLAGVLVQNDTDSDTLSLVNQVEQFEKGLIIKALRRADGNKSKAARTLAIHESTLRAKMKRYDLTLSAAS
ncbi:MAG: sigma 54-interacting transcriptional regulator [candidate division Zixibacteria bacterium]|nr:sigma 54-interacting transcriptional regulator [candidate division Zixibacteria bacterium]